MRLTETGTKLGVHAQKTGFFTHLREAAAQGTPYPLVKLTQNQTDLADVKRDSPSTITMGRVIHGLDGLQGIAEEGTMTDQRAREWASAVMNPTFAYLGQNPGLVEHIDIQEVVNEADPPTVQGWHNFGLVMRECVALGRERYPSIAWGIGSFNAGTPEYPEMQAFLDSGVLDGAPDDVVLCVHEGVLNPGDPGDPIDAGHGDLIPGAPSVPEHGGSMVGRIAYFAELAGADMVPVVVSEAYLQAYDDMAEAASRARWMDGFYSQLWYVLAFCPFTHSPVSNWSHQNYSGMYPLLMSYMAEVATRQNATKPQTEPAQKVEQFVWERALDLAPTNTDAALQKALVASGQYMPYGRERWQEHEPSGDVYAIQPAIDWATGERAVAYALVPEWGNVQIISGPGGEQPGVSIPVPYLSQWGYGAGASRGDCGPACVAMLVRYFTGLGVTVDQAAIASGQAPGSSQASISQLQRGLDYYKVLNTYRQPWTLQALREALDEDTPVILLVHYGAVEGRQDVNFTGGHFFIAVGYGTDAAGDYFLVNDPNFWGDRISEGDHRRVAAAVLDQAMQQATLDGNHPRQGIAVPGPKPPATDAIDLRRFKIGHPDAWRVVRLASGSQEDVQTMQLGNGLFVRRKGNNGEWHRVDANFFYLVHDTSPAPDSQGNARVYTLYKDGVVGAPKSKVHQAVGELWQEEGAHRVRFRARSDCRDLAENSGAAQNSSVITRYAQNVTFNRYGQQLTFDEVIWEQTGQETQIYGRKDGKPCGWIGWSAPWDSAEIVELHWDRGRLTKEPQRHCRW